MKREWNEAEITKALKKMGRTPVDAASYDRVWFKIEERLEKRQKPFWSSFVWRPWSHPIRWVAASALLIVAFTGTLYRMDSAENADLATYLINVSNTPESVTRDPGLIKVSVLLSEPSGLVPDMTVDNHVDPLADDEIFL